MPTTINDIKRILEIIEESPYEEVDIQLDDLRVRASKSGLSAPVVERGPTGPAPPANPAPPAASSAAPSAAIPEGLAVIYAPMVGTVYRAPSPKDPPFCQVGDKVAAEDTVCLIEIMKLFNSIAAGVSGTVKEILVENGALVAYNQPLILIEPD